MFSAVVLALSLSFIGSINIIYCTSSETAASAASTQQTSCQADSKSCAEGPSPHSLYTEKSALAVEMYGEEYRLDTLPAPESSAVTESKRHLLGSIDFMALMNDFGRLGSFIRIAYNGVGAAGPKFTEIQIEIQDIGYSVTKLFDSSALTISRFEIASKTVLNDLQSTYDYLLDNLEDLALETLSSTSSIAEDMVWAAQNLRDHVLVVVMDKMTEFAIKLKNSQGEENMAEIAEEALHKASGALKEISAILMQVIQFWEQMKRHCELLASNDMLKKVQHAIDHYSEDKRLKIWTTTGFKRKAVYLYAQWVALYSVCKEYMKQIKITQRDLYNYLRENPSYEECRQNVKELANKFLSDLELDKRAIAERE